jgi:hypothetical protein
MANNMNNVMNMVVLGMVSGNFDSTRIIQYIIPIIVSFVMIYIKDIIEYIKILFKIRKSSIEIYDTNKNEDNKFYNMILCILKETHNDNNKICYSTIENNSTETNDFLIIKPDLQPMLLNYIDYNFNVNDNKYVVTIKKKKINNNYCLEITATHEKYYDLFFADILEKYTNYQKKLDNPSLKVFEYNDALIHNKIYEMIELIVYNNILSKHMICSTHEGNTKRRNLSDTRIKSEYIPVITSDFNKVIDYVFTFNDNKYTVKIKNCREPRITRSNLIDTYFLIVATHQQYYNVFLNHIRYEYKKKLEQVDELFEFTGDDFKLKNKIKIKKTDENTFLPYEMKKKLDSVIDNFINGEDKYQRFGLCYKLGLMFEGSPGIGKTSLTYYISNKLNLNIYRIPFNILDTKITTTISNIPENSIVLFDDIDMQEGLHNRYNNEDTFGNSNNNTDSDSDVDSDSYIQLNDNKTKNKNKTFTKLANIMNVLDGYNYLHGCIIIFTTNFSDYLDKALIRPGRIDHIFHVTKADQYQIQNIFKYFYDIVLDTEYIDKLNYKLSVSEIINKYIMTDINNYRIVVDKMINDLDETIDQTIHTTI